MGRRTELEETTETPRVMVVFPFAGSSPEEIEAVGRKVIPRRDGTADPEGKSRERLHAYHAGRAALKLAFDYVRQPGFVRSASGYGYLEVVDEEGHPLSGLFANVSHTESIAIAAVADVPIGIDIERIDRSVGNAIKRIASPEELKDAEGWGLESGGRPIPPGIALWCAKEAYAKALGLGLGVGLDRVRFHFDGEGLTPTSTLLGPHHLERPHVRLQLYEEYLIAICSETMVHAEGLRKIRFGIGEF